MLNSLKKISADATAYNSAHFGRGYGSFLEVSCSGNETRLTDCAFDVNHKCFHSRDAGVICGQLLTLTCMIAVKLILYTHSLF